MYANEWTGLPPTEAGWSPPPTSGMAGEWWLPELCGDSHRPPNPQIESSDGVEQWQISTSADWSPVRFNFKPHTPQCGHERRRAVRQDTGVMICAGGGDEGSPNFRPSMSRSGMTLSRERGSHQAARR